MTSGNPRGHCLMMEPLFWEREAGGGFMWDFVWAALGGWLWGTGRRGRDGLRRPTADPRTPVPFPAPSRVRGGPARPVRDSRGCLGRVLPSEHPKDPVAALASRPLPAGRPPGTAPSPRGRPRRAGSAEGVSAARGRRRGPRRRVSASLCRPPSRLPEWAGGQRGQGRREGRGGAGPPPSSFHSHGQSPHPAGPRAQPGLDVGLPPQDPL